MSGWKTTLGRRVTVAAYLMAGDAVAAAGVALAQGFGWEYFARLYLMFTLNFLAIPLGWVFPSWAWWVWYLIILTWIGGWLLWVEVGMSGKSKMNGGLDGALEWAKGFDVGLKQGEKMVR